MLFGIKKAQLASAPLTDAVRPDRCGGGLAERGSDLDSVSVLDALCASFVLFAALVAMVNLYTCIHG